MRRFIILALLLFIMTSPPATSQAASPVVLGYYPSWRPDFGPEKIRYDRFTHINHAFVSVGPDGKPVTTANIPSRALTERANKAHVKVLLAVGGAEGDANRGSFNRMARDPAKARQFVKDIAAMARANGYAGIDIDWESPEKGDEDVVVSFIRDLRHELKAWRTDALLTMAVPATDYSGRWFDGKRLHGQLDFIEIMTYDLHGNWPGSHSGHNSPLHATHTDAIDGMELSYEKFIGYWLGKGFSRSQILVGIPSFGHGFAVSQWGQVPTRASPHADITYNDVLSLIEDGWVVNQDAEAGVPYLTKPGVAEIISYDDALSARAKGEWAKQQRLRGVFFWEISQDYSDGDNVLVKAAREGLAVR